MTRNTMKLTSALHLTTAVLALTAIPAAKAAECFDRETAQPKAGNTTAVVGPDVGLRQVEAAGYNRPSAGDDVFTGDRVRTGDQSHLQLKLCDWSTYSFPPESESRISEFYEEDGAMNRRLVNFVRGGFRLASGRDTRAGATEVEIQESGVTMGVRGTNVILVELDGEIYALLEGPALDNSGLTPQGRVEFWTGENRDAIEARLSRPGWAVKIGPDGVSDPFRADPELLARIYQAFIPAVPGDEGDGVPYEDDPKENSGESQQQGQQGVDAGQKQAKDEDEDTENLPEQPSEGGIPFEERFEQAFPVQIGDILPLEDLEAFAAAQGGASGHFFALAPATLQVDSGSGLVAVDQGVAIIQINFDFASRTIAPEAFASFVKVDFSSAIAGGAIVDDADFGFDQGLAGALSAGLFSNPFNVPFASGQNGLAMFDDQPLTFTVRAGANGTITLDVAAAISGELASDGAFTAGFNFGPIAQSPGAGQLAYFEQSLFGAVSLADLANSSGSQLVSGFGNSVYTTNPTQLDGVSFGQLDINFTNRTIGGPNSFLYVTASSDPAIGGVRREGFLSLNQPVNFATGLFGIGLYPLAGLTTDPDLVAGQALLTQPDGLVVDLAAIIRASGGVNLYSETLLASSFNDPITPFSVFNGLSPNMPLGAEFRFEGEGSASLTTSNQSFLFGSATASIDVNFANRMIGGGQSFVSVDLTNGSQQTVVSFTELVSAISFDRAAGGFSIFGLDRSEFSGTNIDSGVLVIRDGDAGRGPEPASIGQLRLVINDGAGGNGIAELFLGRQVGLTGSLDVGEILPLTALEAFAAQQANPDGHIFVLAPARLDFDDGVESGLVDDGVVLIQLNFDFATRTIAPEAGASFIQFDFSVTNPANLTDDTDFLFDYSVADQLLASFGIPFSEGQNSLAVFSRPLFTLTVRQGAGNTVTVDVTTGVTRPDPQQTGIFTLSADVADLALLPGKGELAIFNRFLSDVFTVDEFNLFQFSGTTRVFGYSVNPVSTLGPPSTSIGLTYGQIEINFDNRTIGSAASFIVTTESSAGANGEFGNAFLPLNVPTPFASGLFGRAFYPLSALSTGGALVAGEALAGTDPFNDGQFFVDLVSILEADTGAHLASETTLDRQFFGSAFAFAPTSIAQLGSVAQLGEFHFNSGDGGFAQLSNDQTGFFQGSLSAQIDISFANRTIGGGDSFVNASLFNFQTSATFDLLELVAPVSFDDALGGLGVFALDDADFDGDLLQSALFIIRNDGEGGVATSADLFVNFTDGAGGEGIGEILNLFRTPGSAVCGPCN